MDNLWHFQDQSLECVVIAKLHYAERNKIN
jgi:hypothetical protein